MTLLRYAPPCRVWFHVECMESSFGYSATFVHKLEPSVKELERPVDFVDMFGTKSAGVFIQPSR